MKIVGTIVISFVVLLFGLQVWRYTDNRMAVHTWEHLSRKAGEATIEFHPSMVAGLPEVARRYLLYTIETGTPIRTVCEVHMHGEIGLGNKDNPNYQPMRAEQILAPPYGLVWRLIAGKGLMHISGSDGVDGQTSWVRFWLANAIPIVRTGGNPSHARAAFGRVVAEAVFWTPAVLLPADGVSWEEVSENVARVTLTYNGMSQSADIAINAEGQPTTVVIPRWTDANPDKTYRLQPFGGYLSDFQDFDGYRLPTRVEGGNFIGTEEYFPFYKARVDAIRFVAP